MTAHPSLPLGTSAAGVRPAPLRRDFPIFAEQSGAGVPRLRAPARKSRRSVIDGVAELLPHRLRQRASRRLSAERALDRAVRGGARDACARFLNAADASEIVFVRGATEAINLVAYSWGAAFLKAGDEVLSSPSSSITPISCRGRLLRDRIGFKLVVAPIDATGGLDLAAFEALLDAAHQAGRGDAARQRHRRDGAGRDASRSWRMPRAPRCWSTAARRRRACRSMCRRSAAISMSSPATRSTGRPASACCRARHELLDGDAALAGRRRHDPQRHLREDRLPGPAAPLRGRHARHFRRASGSRSRSILSRALGRDAILRARGGADRLRRRPAVARCRACSWSAPGSGGSASCRSMSRACTRTMWRPCSTSTVSRCGPGIIARSR